MFNFRKVFRYAVIGLALPAVLFAARSAVRPLARSEAAKPEFLHVTHYYECGHTEREVVARDYMREHPERYDDLQTNESGGLYALRAGVCSKHYRLSSGERGVDVLKRDINSDTWHVLMTLPIEYEANSSRLYDSFEQIEHVLEDWES